MSKFNPHVSEHLMCHFESKNGHIFSQQSEQSSERGHSCTDGKVSGQARQSCLVLATDHKGVLDVRHIA